MCHRLKGGTYTITQHAQGDTELRSKSFKGLRVRLADLWAVLPD